MKKARQKKRKRKNKRRRRATPDSQRVPGGAGCVEYAFDFRRGAVELDLDAKTLDEAGKAALAGDLLSNEHREHLGKMLKLLKKIPPEVMEAASAELIDVPIPEEASS